MSRRKTESGWNMRTLFAIGEKTKYWIFSICAFAGAFFLILAALEQAGVIGGRVYALLSSLFGLGYFLFPSIFILLGGIFLRNRRPFFVFTSLLGGILLFFSGLGIIGILEKDGGIVGAFVSALLVKYFDFFAALIITIAALLISLLLIFDTTPTFAWISWLLKMFQKKYLSPEEAAGIKEQGNFEETREAVAGNTASGDEPSRGNESASEGGAGDDSKYSSIKNIFSSEKKAKNAQKIDSAMYSFLVAGTYTPPPLSLLGGDKGKPEYGDIKANSNIIKRTLQNFGINVEMDEVSVGPSVTRYSLKPAQGIKLARIVGLQNDLSLALAAHPIRIEAPIPGRSLVGIEIPNSSRTTVGLSTLLDTQEFRDSKLPLFISIGRGITGRPYFGNLARMPHLLIAGSTGSGKSVAIHTIITSLLYRNSPANLRLIMVDPKRVELTLYNEIPHLLTPVVTDAKKAILALKWAAREMERRYDIFETESVRDIESYHKNIVLPAYATKSHSEKESGASVRGSDERARAGLPEQMPYIVIVIDELADIMSTYPRELEAAVVRLAQMSRAVGVHLILSTQRPSVNVITGLIKANIPARMAFQVTSQVDSRTVLDMGGAEKLLGAGDMLYVSGEMSKPVRLQSAFISEAEIKKVTSFLRKEYGESTPDVHITDSTEKEDSISLALQKEEDDENVDDELYEEARETVIKTGKASTTFLQRKLRVGYARAARLMDMLEEYGVVGPADGARPREVLEKHTNDGYGRQEEN